MQVCTIDEDCIYVDNSCCPFTDGDNIVTINEAYKEQYRALGESCPEDLVCQENSVEPASDAKCLNNKCTGAKLNLSCLETDLPETECVVYG